MAGVANSFLKESGTISNRNAVFTLVFALCISASERRNDPGKLFFFFFAPDYCARWSGMQHSLQRAYVIPLEIAGDRTTARNTFRGRYLQRKK